MKALKMIAVSLAFAVASAHAASGDTTVTTPTATVTGSAVSVGGTSVSLNVEGAPTVVGTTPTSVTLEWKKVDAAVSYIVKYSTKSVATSADPNAVYDNETSPVTETGATVDKLTAGSTYYFAVVALDKEGNESDSLSEEVEVNLSKVSATTVSASGSASASSFALASVTPKNTRTLVLEFSAALGTDPLQIKLQKTSNSAAVEVQSAVVDSANPTTATVTLASDLEADSSYSLTVISAKDAAGNNIPEGINAIKEFTTLASLAPATEVPLNAASATGATASGATATGVVAPEALPQTGTKENLLMILALLSGLGIVFAFRKKAA
ncbi:MAG: fibronectin type III domain-containing protein [Patescibacteria group bacterium]